MNREKFEVLTRPSTPPQRIEQVLFERKEVIERVVEPTIIKLLAMLYKIEKKSKDIISLLASVPES